MIRGIFVEAPCYTISCLSTSTPVVYSEVFVFQVVILNLMWICLSNKVSFSSELIWLFLLSFDWLRIS